MTTPDQQDIVHWVDGAALTGSPTGWGDVTNPATGRVTGPHLHWELYVGSRQVNPLTWTEVVFP